MTDDTFDLDACEKTGKNLEAMLVKNGRMRLKNLLLIYRLALKRQIP